MDDKIKIKDLNPIAQNDFKESAEFPISQDGETYKASISQVIQKVTDNQDDKYFKKTEKIPNENLTFGEVKEGDSNVVSGGYVYNVLNKSFCKNKNNLISKENIVKGSYVASTGDILNAPNARRTNEISITEGTVYTIGGGGTTDRMLVYNNSNGKRLINGMSFEAMAGETHCIVSITSNQGDIYNDTITLTEGVMPFSSLKSGDLFKNCEQDNTKVASKQLFNGKYNSKILVGGDDSYCLKQSSGDAFTTELIYLKETDKITIVGLKSRNRVAFLDEKQRVLSKIMVTEGRDVLQVPLNTKYMLLTFKQTGESLHVLNNIFIHYGDSVETKDEYKESFIYDTNEKQSYRDVTKAINSPNFDVKNSNKKIKEGASFPIILTDVKGNDDVAIVIAHYGTQGFTQENRHVFFNENCDKDFKDIRFKGENGEFLDFEMVSSGNYELIPDERIEQIVLIDSNGKLFLSSRDSDFGIWSSHNDLKDRKREIVRGSLVFIDSKDDIYYSIFNVLYKATKENNYNDSRVIKTMNEGDNMYSTSFVETTGGALIMGIYQDVFNCRVFKSTDYGNSWSENILPKNKQQHVHSIVYDKLKNIIYVNTDGVDIDPASRPRTFRSYDEGGSFEEMVFETKTNGEFPFSKWYPDYGVLYCGDNFTIGSGEGGIKPIPTIYKTKNDISTIKMDVAQNIQRITEFDGVLYATGGAYNQNKYAKIYRSEDKGETWETIIDNKFESRNAMGYTYRAGSAREAITPERGEKQAMFLVRDAPTRYKPLRLYQGGNHYQALFYVKTKGNTTITAESGYVDAIVSNTVSNVEIFSENLIFNLKLNELENKTTDNNSNYYDVKSFKQDNYSRIGWFYPEKNKKIDGGVLMDNLDLDVVNDSLKRINIEQGITFDFFIKIDDWDKEATNAEYDKTNKFMFGFVSEKNNLFFSRHVLRRLNLNYSDKKTAYGGISFNPNMCRVSARITVSISKTKVMFFTNGSLVNERAIDLSGIVLDYNSFKVGGFPFSEYKIDSGDKSVISNLNIYNTAFTEEDARMLYEGCNLIG